MATQNRSLIFLLLLGAFSAITGVAYAGPPPQAMISPSQPDPTRSSVRAWGDGQGNGLKSAHAHAALSQPPMGAGSSPKVPQDGGLIFLPMIFKSPAPGWATILSDDFEGAWPGPWMVGLPNASYYWGKRNCRAYAGGYSAWAVGGGSAGAGLPCGSYYPNNTTAHMFYGPFSLSSATAADLQFKLWINSQSGYDFVCRYASIDGTNFYGTCTSGSSSGGWIDRVLDFSGVYTLGNILGQPNVWIMIEFDSNGSVNYAEGAHIDNVVLRKCMVACPAGSSAAPAVGGTIVEWAASKTLDK